MSPCLGIVLFALSAFTPAERLSVWYAPSASKVMRDASPAASPREWDIAIARNEVEACQLVLASDRPVKGVTVSVSMVNGAGAKTGIEAALYRVEYVPIHKNRILYPDPLPPLTGPFDLEPGRAQPVWITIRVPKDAGPGVYRGIVKVKAGSSIQKLPLSIRVWGFTLPETPACVTAFGNDPETVAEWHGIPPRSLKASALAHKYYEFLLEHRISSYRIPADLLSEEAVPYLNDPRMTSYLIPFNSDRSEEDLKTLVGRLIDGGWFAKGFFYVVDEPITKDAYAQFEAITDRLRRIEPRYRIVLPFWRNPGFDATLRARDLMFGRVNIWCPHLLYLDSEPDFRAFLRSRGRAGESIWWYVCNNPRGEYTNIEIDMSAMSHRALLWQQRREGIQGLLYWHTTYWNKKYIDDPWRNMDTLGEDIPGDGSLLYPGNKVGLDGPVGSLRLEVLRDGLEDFDFLAIADRVLGPEVTAGFVARVARTSTDYERDPARFERVRRALGDAIEKAMARPGKS